MKISNTPETYGWGSQLIHWLTALLILSLFSLALIMTDMDNSPEKFQLYGLHKSLGGIVIALTVLRIVWVLVQTKPDDIPGISSIQHLAAKAAHGLLYLWLLAMPLSGWIMSNASGYPVKLFDLVALPNLIDKNKEIAGFAHETHEILGTLGMVLIGIHVAAALWHHFGLKNNTLLRMMPGYKPSTPSNEM